MKKLPLLLIAPVILAAVGTGVGITYAQKVDDIELNKQQTITLTEYFKNPFQVNSRVAFGYENFAPGLNLIDQIEEGKRSNKIYRGSMLVSDVHMASTSTGGTTQEYLGLNNKITQREIKTNDGSEVSYDTYYGNPFKAFSNLSNEQVNKYFDIKKVGENYEISANDLGYGVITSSMSTFVADFDPFVWDDQTLSYVIEDFKMELEKNGTPISFSYSKIKKDKFGAVKDTISSKFTAILEVESLKPFESKLTEEQRNTFVTNMSNFQDKIKLGNFTEVLTYSNKDIGTYKNFYALDGSTAGVPSMMLSDRYLYDGNYGKTYVGVMKKADGYQQYAISPEAGVNDAISQDMYPNLSDVLPELSFISPDFFVYTNDMYVFDISKFLYADTAFDLDILRTTVGLCDPVVSFIGGYINYNAYNFGGLSFKFDENGIPTGSLIYMYNNNMESTTFSFENIGTTNLLNEPSIKEAMDSLLAE